MPRIKRYGPLAHGFNRDPEIRALRQQYADWMGYVWQEMCLIADLNGGEIRGSPQQISESLAYVSLLKRPSLAAKCITNALGFMEKCGWINIQTDRVLVLKYAKYHPSENQLAVPTNERTNEHNEHKEEKKKNKRAQVELPAWLPLDNWNGFLEYRKRIRKPLTDRGITLAINTLGTLKNLGNDPGSVLDQSVTNGWTGLFELKNGGANGTDRANQDRQSHQPEPKGFESVRGFLALHNKS